ncbi:hypothetical protein CJU90_3334 [Yarrowia sp. C11]|nr:hypothetical protein CKK34_4780 [Yarrowia sp. E02]KAG5369800.1 hypothetical protein CJU90_3334 [Yarrowia sp. C11]
MKFSAISIAAAASIVVADPIFLGKPAAGGVDPNTFWFSQSETPTPAPPAPAPSTVAPAPAVTTEAPPAPAPTAEETCIAPAAAEKRSLALISQVFCTKKCFKLSFGLKTCQGLQSCECQFLDGFAWTQKCLSCAQAYPQYGMQEIEDVIKKCHPEAASSSIAPPPVIVTTTPPDVTTSLPECEVPPPTCTPEPAYPSSLDNMLNKRFDLIGKLTCKKTCNKVVFDLKACGDDAKCICDKIAATKSAVDQCTSCVQQYNMWPYFNVDKQLLQYVEACKAVASPTVTPTPIIPVCPTEGATTEPEPSSTPAPSTDAESTTEPSTLAESTTEPASSPVPTNGTVPSSSASYTTKTLTSTIPCHECEGGDKTVIVTVTEECSTEVPSSTAPLTTKTTVIGDKTITVTEECHECEEKTASPSLTTKTTVIGDKTVTVTEECSTEATPAPLTTYTTVVEGVTKTITEECSTEVPATEAPVPTPEAPAASPAPSADITTKITIVEGITKTLVGSSTIVPVPAPSAPAVEPKPEVPAAPGNGTIPAVPQVPEQSVPVQANGAVTKGVSAAVLAAAGLLALF